MALKLNQTVKNQDFFNLNNPDLSNRKLAPYLLNPTEFTCAITSQNLKFDQFDKIFDDDDNNLVDDDNNLVDDDNKSYFIFNYFKKNFFLNDFFILYSIASILFYIV